MQLYRLGVCHYADSLSGEGAKIYGGRWNSEGVPAVYFASSRALAVLEVLVHLPTGLLPKNYCMAIFEFDAEFAEFNPEDLPEKWQVYPFLKRTQTLGNQFFKQNEFPVLKVPSAIVSGDFNYVANPLHPYIKKIKFIEKVSFSFDDRLL
ncbi:RES family NAD+ phosphorylase [Pedobacter arcticus]|uniref:RES family NAD+ phosphorylase n=1 Tax=Pedobacter arcticus TaxID=752140 RepID=UPI000309E60A|nr:RES family NAD+ phosphorylase [Pedobacter arcticus]